MSIETTRRPERRSSVRVKAKGTASLRTSALEVRGRVADVGRGGLSVIAVPSEAPLPGASVDVEIRFDVPDATWLQLSGRILRIDGARIALAFESVPTGFDRLIDEALTASYGNDRILSLVIVDAETARRARIAEAFRVAGCAVLDVSTPLEAIVRLGELHFEPDLIAVADTAPALIGDEMRTFIEREHPHAKLVAITDDIVEPDGLEHWLSSMDPDDDLPARIRTLLMRPHHA